MLDIGLLFGWCDWVGCMIGHGCSLGGIGGGGV